MLLIWDIAIQLTEPHSIRRRAAVCPPLRNTLRGVTTRRLLCKQKPCNKWNLVSGIEDGMVWAKYFENEIKLTSNLCRERIPFDRHWPVTFWLLLDEVPLIRCIVPDICRIIFLCRCSFEVECASQTVRKPGYVCNVLPGSWASERRAKGGLDPWNFEIWCFPITFLASKGCSLSFEREKENFPAFGPPLEKSYWPHLYRKIHYCLPLEKILSSLMARFIVFAPIHVSRKSLSHESPEHNNVKTH